MKMLNLKHLEMSRLRRLVVLLLALCLLPSIALSAPAGEKPVTNLFGSVLADDLSSINSLALAGDTLYIRTGNALYTYGTGDSQAVKRMELPDAYGLDTYSKNDAEQTEPHITLLLSDGQQLLGLDLNQQTLYTLKLEGDKLLTSDGVKLDLSGFVSGEEPNVRTQEPAWARIIDGRLYMKKSNYEGEPADLYSIDLKSGDSKLHQVNNLLSAAPYKDGKIIAISLDILNEYTEQWCKVQYENAIGYCKTKWLYLYRSLQPEKTTVPGYFAQTGVAKVLSTIYVLVCGYDGNTLSEGDLISIHQWDQTNATIHMMRDVTSIPVTCLEYIPFVPWDAAQSGDLIGGFTTYYNAFFCAENQQAV